MNERQPTRGRVVPDRRFDKTQLKMSGHGRTVHRDYAAHVLRWEFAARELPNDHPELHPYLKSIFFKYGWVGRQVKQDMKILDVGCGQEQPLLYVLGKNIQTVPEVYVGVDYNRISKKSNVRWAKVYDEFDFVTNGLKLRDAHGPFDLAVCFEVIEHMNTKDGALLLERIYECLTDDGKLYLSTPVFNGSAAANHIHEYTVPELRDALEDTGFTVAERIGTFASKPDILHAIGKAGDVCAMDVYLRLEKWFGGDVMSVFMAALYPDASRNNLWVCTK
jgi:2-polyprenyl-3-methyl-5-hydroxy-6-metoxy-1,4-benzoquinol methylase